jgi:hypothetical protein
MAYVIKFYKCPHVKVCKLCGPDLCPEDCGHYIGNSSSAGLKPEFVDKSVEVLYRMKQMIDYLESGNPIYVYNDNPTKDQTGS